MLSLYLHSLPPRLQPQNELFHLRLHHIQSLPDPQFLLAFLSLSWFSSIDQSCRDELSHNLTSYCEQRVQQNNEFKKKEKKEIEGKINLHIRNPPNNQTITRLNPLPTAQSVGLCYSRMDSRPDRPYWHRNITFALFVLVILVRSLLSRSSKCVFGVLSSSSSSFVEIGVSAMSCVKVSGRTAVEESSISLWSDAVNKIVG